MQGGFKDKAPLRVLQERLRVVSRDQAASASSRSIAFMLLGWVEKYYSNLSGGFPSAASERIKQIRGRLLREAVGPALCAMASALSDTPATCLEHYSVMTAALLDSFILVEQEAGV